MTARGNKFHFGIRRTYGLRIFQATLALGNDHEELSEAFLSSSSGSGHLIHSFLINSAVIFYTFYSFTFF